MVEINSYIPQAPEHEFCEGMKLCAVRQTKEGQAKVAVKTLSGQVEEKILSEVINADHYQGKEIVREYSSGHVFLRDGKDEEKEVYLVTVEKDQDGTVQHQFTGGSPREEENKKVISKQGGVYRFDLDKVRDNARIRTKNRTGVEVIEEYNQMPLVDWVLMEKEKDGQIYYRLLCLMHFMVKKYNGVLGCEHVDKEVLGGQWYQIGSLPNTKDVAPNAYIVSREAVDLLL